MIELFHVFWIGAIGMAVGTVAFAWAGLTSEKASRYYLTLVGISGIATVAYVIMALGYGGVNVDGRTVFTPRYVDWILTTPLLLLFLGMLAGVSRKGLALLISVNTAVMVLGFAGALLPGSERFALFGLASVFYVALVYLLVGSVSRVARSSDQRVTSLFNSLRNLTVILWTVYPIIWLLGPPGMDLLTVTVEVALITYLDILTKVGFGLIALNASTVINRYGTESGVAEGVAQEPA